MLTYADVCCWTPDTPQRGCFSFFTSTLSLSICRETCRIAGTVPCADSTHLILSLSAPLPAHPVSEVINRALMLFCLFFSRYLFIFASINPWMSMHLSIEVCIHCLNTYFVCKGNFWVTLNSSCYYIPHTTTHTCRATMDLILYKHPHVTGLLLRDTVATEYCPSQPDPGSDHQNFERERERENRVKLFNLFLMSQLCTVSCLMQPSFNPHSSSSLTENEVPLLGTFMYISSWD
jgi:hypothetical protein